MANDKNKGLLAAIDIALAQSDFAYDCSVASA